MSIRRFKARSDRSTHDAAEKYDEGAKLISFAIRDIFEKNAGKLSYEQLYRTTYNITLSGMHVKLYNDVKQVVSEVLDAVAKDIIVPAFVKTNDQWNDSTDAGASFLKTVNVAWDDYKNAITTSARFLLYIEKHLEKAKLPCIMDMGYDLFRDKIVRSEKYPIQSHLIGAMLNQIQRERHGEVIDRTAIKSSVSMLSDLSDPVSESVYVIDFESKFVETSTAFYESESHTLTSTYEASGLMKKVDERLDEEYKRATHCLSPSTEPKIRAIVEKELIANNLRTIMEMPNSGLVSMLSADKHTDLLRMYKLFSRVPAGLDEMKSEISKYILQLGADINSAVKNATDNKLGEKGQAGGALAATRWVEKVLDLQTKFDHILEKSTEKDKSFQVAFNEAFEQFINENVKSAEFMSLFIDEKLKKGLKGRTENEVDEVLEKTTTLFRFLRDKDVFERYYKQHLAKRLLFNRSVSDDVEKNMLSKLKRECGYQFTAKLEGMFNDIRLSLDMNTGFKEFVDHSSTLTLGFDASVTVLTSTFWPMNLSSSPKCVFPDQLSNACKAFESFYFDRHSGRRLTWQPQMGTADIRAQFAKSKHTLNVSTFALMVLLLFNCPSDSSGEDALSFHDIQEQTHIPESDLKRTLQSLACGKYKVLLKQEKGRDVQPTDRFVFNSAFTSNLARIKIQTVSSRVETDTERKQTQEKVDEERKHQIEAAIVRLMKDRKTIEHNMLVASVTQQLSARFMPHPVMIKKRIEALIDREYLERSAQDRRSYRYLA